MVNGLFLPNKKQLLREAVLCQKELNYIELVDVLLPRYGGKRFYPELVDSFRAFRAHDFGIPVITC